MASKENVRTQTDRRRHRSKRAQRNKKDEANMYIVEQILKSGLLDDGRAAYLVKWRGYSDTTWEPEENLVTAKDLVDEFHASRVSKKASSKPASNKKSAGSSRKVAKNKPIKQEPDSPEPFAVAQTTGSAQHWRSDDRSSRMSYEDTIRLQTSSPQTISPDPPSAADLAGSWETVVKEILQVHKRRAEGSEVTMLWTDGTKSSHDLDVVRERCPQRLLDHEENWKQSLFENLGVIVGQLMEAGYC